jgi:phosphohistidine phosphatase
MVDLGIAYDLILSSPLRRARETSDLVVEVMRHTSRAVETDLLKPGASISALVTFLRRNHPARNSILLVGHEPDLGNLLSLLTTGDTGLAVDFRKGGLCKLEAGRLRPGRCATLCWFLPPKILLRGPER